MSHFLDDVDVLPFVNRAESDPKTTILTESADPSSRSLTFLTHLQSESSDSVTDDNALPGPATIGRVVSHSAQRAHRLLFRQLIFAPALSAEAEAQLRTDLAAFERWQKQRAAYDHSLEVQDGRTEQDLQAEAELQV